MKKVDFVDGKFVTEEIEKHSEDEMTIEPEVDIVELAQDCEEEEDSKMLKFNIVEPVMPKGVELCKTAGDECVAIKIAATNGWQKLTIAEVKGLINSLYELI